MANRTAYVQGCQQLFSVQSVDYQPEKVVRSDKTGPFQPKPVFKLRVVQILATRGSADRLNQDHWRIRYSELPGYAVTSHQSSFGQPYVVKTAHEVPNLIVVQVTGYFGKGPVAHDANLRFEILRNLPRNQTDKPCKGRSHHLPSRSPSLIAPRI